MYACPKCNSTITIDHEVNSCSECGFEVKFENNKIKYNFDKLLFDRFNERYLLNKVLNNNGILSYQLLAEESISLDDREDVVHFRGFIEKNIDKESKDKKKKLIDIGCGPLQLPGYLNFNSIDQYELYGIEPEEDSKFCGQLITGCCEYMPIQNNVFDVAVFATSFDHLCSIEKSIQEVKRVLNKDGKVFLWISDKSSSKKTWLGRVIHKLKVLRKSFMLGYRIDRYVIYPNGTVLYVPVGAIDPFHSYFESPKETIAFFEKEGFVLTDYQYNNQNEVFILLENS